MRKKLTKVKENYMWNLFKSFGLALVLVTFIDAALYQVALSYVAWIKPTVSCVIFNGWPICF